MKKKTLIFWSCIITLILFLPSSITATKEAYIYVDDDNTDGPWNGTEEHPYQKIQDGINAAKKHDTVFVFPGVYHEHLHINAPLCLRGETPTTTFIYSSDTKDIIQVVDTEAVTIQNFHLEHNLNSSEYLAGIYLKNTSFSIMENLSIIGCYDGVLIKGNNNRIRNSSIHHNKNGICFGHYRATPHQSHLTNLEQFFYSHIQNNISENRIYHNIEAGIDLSFTTQNTIMKNNISENTYGIRLRKSPDNIIRKNNLFSNTLHAFAFDESINHWQKNYWDNWIGLSLPLLSFLPKYIPSIIGQNYDWHPATQPSEI